MLLNLLSVHGISVGSARLLFSKMQRIKIDLDKWRYILAYHTINKITIRRVNVSRKVRDTDIQMVLD